MIDHAHFFRPNGKSMQKEALCLPPGGFTTQGQFLANTTPEQRSRMAVAGAVGLTPAAAYVAGPGLVAAAQTPFGRELIKESAKGAGMYSAYRVTRAIKNLIFGADNQ